MEWSKYVLSLIVGGCLVLLFGKKGTGRDKWIAGGGAGLSLVSMELAVEYMLNEAAWKMALSLMKGGAFCSLIVLSGYAWEWFRDRKKEECTDLLTLHPVRKWIEEYQESFSMLSRSFCMMPQTAEGLNRGELLLQTRLAENRAAAAGQIQEMSQILTGAMERIYGTKEDQSLEQEIGGRLRLLGIRVEHVFLYGPNGKKRQVYVMMHTRKKMCVPVKKVAGILSELLECEMMPDRDSRTFVGQEPVTVLFVEAASYNVLYGVRKTTRSGEAVSGDNFSVFWVPDGLFYAGLSDGMGSGLQACSQSEMVLDLLEQFVEAGFSKETAIRMINSSMVLQSNTGIFSTLDLAAVDLYTGVCEFLKIGASASFLRREQGVECIRGGTIPAGITGQLEIESYRIRMYDGNLLFLVTDGVLAALPDGQEEALMKELIRRIPLGTPSEMAQYLLEQVQAYGGKKDDMTVMVVGLWKR